MFPNIILNTVKCGCATMRGLVRTQHSKRGATYFLQKFAHKRFLSTTLSKQFKDSVSIAFIDRTGVKIKVEADVGDTLLDVAKDNDIDGVEGACGGTLACSTCHCIFAQQDFDRLKLGDICDDEMDMLDLAYGLSDTSRLVCAIDLTEEMDGIEITVPTNTNDARTT